MGKKGFFEKTMAKVMKDGSLDPITKEEFDRFLQKNRVDLTELIDAAIDSRVTPDDLRTFAATYGKPCQFKAGDLVTAMPDGDEHAPGEAALVLEVLAKPMLVMETEHGWTSNYWGVRLDMRILHASDGTGFIHPHWVESWKYRAWNDPMTAAVDLPPTKPFEEA